MARKVSAKRYAQAVFELALERDQLDRWAGDLELVDRVVRDGEFRAFLKHADISAGNKAKAVEDVLQEADPLVRNLVHILVNRGLVDLLPGLLEAYTAQLDVHRGRQRVSVTSAVPLEPPEMERITRFVSNLVRKEVVVSTQVDESILGGVVVQVGDRLLDGSTRSRLDALRNSMLSGVAVAGA